MKLRRKDVLGIEEMSPAEIELILDTAVPMKDIILRKIKKVPTLRGKSIVNLFYEPSTRTKTSFELAGKYLSADTVGVSLGSSSIVKGESLKDTAKTIASMGVDLIVMRHLKAGAARILAEAVDASVINAGDGAHEHPTQALLDMFTIREMKGGLKGLRVAIIGDILHSRVARSNIWGLTKMGAEVRVAGPATLLPAFVERMGARVYTNADDAIRGVDLVYLLRIQLERQQEGLFPSLREYSNLYGLNRDRLALADKGALIMHPGPINRGVEIGCDLAYSTQSVIEEQVTNGVAVRMALLYLLIGGGNFGG